MVEVQEDVLPPPHCTTPAVVKIDKKKKMSSFKSNVKCHSDMSPVHISEWDIHKKEDAWYYVVSANKASSVTL